MNKTIAGLLLNLVAYIVLMATSILVMIYGWGIQPKSWFWIIFMYGLGLLIGSIFTVVAKKLEKED